MRKFTGHGGIANDVAWHRSQSALFASVGDDHRLMLWDTRSPISTYLLQSILAHTGAVNCLAFNSFSENLILTGSADTVQGVH
jgi:histone-binding protein RBBP4